MSDIGVSAEFQRMAEIYFISSFLFGFIPGIYLSSMLIRKIKKLEKVKKFSIGISIIIGFSVGYYSNQYFFWGDLTSINNNFITFINYNIPYIVVAEFIFVITHFFFNMNRKKKR